MGLRPAAHYAVSHAGASVVLPYVRGKQQELKAVREAIEAGATWFEAELFSGKPELQKLLDVESPELNESEQAFLDGPVEELCAMTDDWEVFQKRDLSPQVWAKMKELGFFGRW